MMQGGINSTCPMYGSAGTWLALAAQTLHLDQHTLLSELQAGKTLAQVAQEHGVSLDTLINALMAPYVAHMQSLVASGSMTQAQLERMEAQMRVRLQWMAQQPWNAAGSWFMGPCW